MPRTIATVTLRDVAQAAGVSKTTVGCVLNDTPHFSVPEATRERIHAAAARLGYRRNALAAALTKGRIHTIGVVMPLRYVTEEITPEFGQVYAKDALIAIADAARKTGLRITLTPCDDEAPDTLATVAELTDGRVDGLILVSLRNNTFAQAVYETQFPCVTIGSGYAERPIRLDNLAGGVTVANHLLSLGHRRLTWYCGASLLGASTEREQGFLSAVLAAGISPENLVKADNPDALRRLLALSTDERPTAIAAFNDWYAHQAVGIARKIGLTVPDALSVVGFDDNLFAQTCDPPLTTVRNPLRELAGEALAVLQQLWKGDPFPPLPAPVPAHLIVRSSTGPAPIQV